MKEGSSAGLEPGQRVEILGGAFAGRQGVVEGVTASGKLQVRVETLGTFAHARVPREQLRPVPGRSEGS